MAATEILRARVEKEFAERVARWAKAHDMDLSETIRRGLQLLLEEEDRERARAARLAEVRRNMEKAAELGLFDPPPDDSWKAGGFR